MFRRHRYIMAIDPYANPPDHSPPGYTATFHLPDGSRLIVAVAGATAFSCGGGQGPTRLELRGPDRSILARGDLSGLLRKAGRGR